MHNHSLCDDRSAFLFKSRQLAFFSSSTTTRGTRFLSVSLDGVVIRQALVGAQAPHAAPLRVTAMRELMFSTFALNLCPISRTLEWGFAMGFSRSFAFAIDNYL